MSPYLVMAALKSLWFMTPTDHTQTKLVYDTPGLIPPLFVSKLFVQVFLLCNPVLLLIVV